MTLETLKDIVVDLRVKLRSAERQVNNLQLENDALKRQVVQLNTQLEEDVVQLKTQLKEGRVVAAEKLIFDNVVEYVALFLTLLLPNSSYNIVERPSRGMGGHLSSLPVLSGA